MVVTLQSMFAGARQELDCLKPHLENFKIQGCVPAENINVAVSTLHSLGLQLKNLYSFAYPSHSELPDNTVRFLLNVLATTSVDKFNVIWTKMSTDLTNGPMYKAAGIISPDTTIIGEDWNAYNAICHGARLSYQQLLLNNEWKHVIAAPPGKSGFTTSPPADADTVTDGTKQEGDITCFNCGGKHHLRSCTLPRDEAKIRENRAKHPHGSRTAPGQQPTTFKERPDWSAPKPGETHRLICSWGKTKTYSWNAATNKWLPPSKAALLTPTPPGSAPTAPPADSNINLTASDEDKAKATKKLHLAWVLAQTQAELAAL